ncbi:hypothetical protein C8J56DRAFT_1049073 [Mycena floridula]|nr:hypothetical protein C8J56DRAFT_1049073 [Mycena floridula]
MSTAKLLSLTAPVAPRFHVDVLSADGRRIQHTMHDAAPPSLIKKRIIKETISLAHEHFATFDSEEVEPRPFAGLYEEENEVNVDEDAKAKHYISSRKQDEPLKLWMPLRDSYMEEIIKLQASKQAGKPCSHCPVEATAGIALMRCQDCFEMEPVCQTCCVYEHAQMPLHIIERWNGTFFERVGLEKLGLRVQLGHGKVTPFDYYTGLQCLMDNTGCHKVADRYRSFLRMGCEFRHLRSCKRAGRANYGGRGIQETKPGELAVECPACPNPSLNLPANWAKATGQKRLLYIMFIAVDACFRLKCKIVSSDQKDPGLGTGWAYFVEDAPYQEYVKSLGDQEEVNTCTGLSAVDHANTCFSCGYAVTGVGLALCARHEFVGKNAAGDLQVGEKFGNMTYVLVSFLWHFYKNFVTRVKELPALVRFKVVWSLFHWVIPKLHILGHKVACQLAFNLNYMLGAARTDGEGVERPWANIGPVVTSTQEMGPGHRHDTLDDHWHDWNWRKIIGLAKLLARRLQEALEEFKVQDEAFGSFSSNQLEEVPTWAAMVEAWEADPENNRNPYEQQKSTITLQKVRLELSIEEATLARAGMPGVHQCSLAEFLLRGMDIEEQQRKLSREAHLLGPTPTTKQTANLNNKRNKVM